ncbi:uncharacterized protein LOC142771957 isoform X2 [Rhipicephalus microplus]|uniref:uncharacterized protein LOC142771957 isoform X2 n=1 Tax=Rhipicephalus microplus TaxID=6941 RepID=UPI003F6C69F0
MSSMGGAHVQGSTEFCRLPDLNKKRRVYLQSHPVVRLQQTVLVQQVAQCGAIQTRCIVMDKTTQDLGLAQTRPLMVPSQGPVETRLVTKNGGIQILQ